MSTLTLGSLFAGIGGFDAGFEQAGWETKWQVEKEPYCRAVLATHFPRARRFADVRTVGRKRLERVDCITGGFPCQDVSVAGQRAGILRRAQKRGRTLPPQLLAALEKVALPIPSTTTLLQCPSPDIQDGAARIGIPISPRHSPPEVPSTETALDAGERMTKISSPHSGQNTENSPTVETEAIPLLLQPSPRKRRSKASPAIQPQGPAILLSPSTPHKLPAVKTDQTHSPAIPATLFPQEHTPQQSPTPCAAIPAGRNRDTIAPTLAAKNDNFGGRKMREKWQEQAAEAMGTVRRLTPTECETLQGFPKGWTVPAIEHWATPSRSKLRHGSQPE